MDDEYTAFCFDEACAYIFSMLDQGETPKYQGTAEDLDAFYKSFYKSLEG